MAYTSRHMTGCTGLRVREQWIDWYEFMSARFQVWAHRERRSKHVTAQLTRGL